MTNNNSSKTNTDEQVSRRSFLSKSAAGLGAAALTGNVFGQTKTLVAPNPDKADPNGKFKDKVVLITGATSGIGEGSADAFAREGAKVFFCGRRENLGRQVESRIKSFGGEATYFRADVRREADVKNFVDAAVKKYGKLDIAFNNAGIETPTAAPLADQSLEDFMNVMTTNAVGYFLSMKYELPVLLRNHPSGAFGTRGIIVNNASVSGRVGYATISPYNASKHAIMGLTKTAALEYTAQGIRITAISPGAVDTPMLARALKGFKTTAEQTAKTIPIQRINTVEEIARVVMFLSSDDASSVVGTDVDLTGGMLTGAYSMPPSS